MSKVQCKQQRAATLMGSSSADEFSDVAERIFHNLNVVFERDDSLDEFDIKPVESKSNRSPVIHINHKLAIESWCVPFLYTHSFKNFVCLLPKNRLNPSSSIRNINSCSKEMSSRVATLSESERISRALQLSRALILLNPDLTLSWNYRREIFNTSLDLKLLRKELRLVSLTATRKPKCPEGFTYRKWLVKKSLEEHLLQDVLEFFEEETAAAEIAASKYFSNYHAWSYRLWLIEFLLDSNEYLNSVEKQSIVEKEYEKSTLWVESHVSDYSGFHYRQKILHFIGKLHAKQTIVDKLNLELEENLKMIRLYPGHESLWYHRRAILRHFVHKTSNFADDKCKEYLRCTQEMEKHLVEFMQPETTDTKANPSQNKYSELNTRYSQRHQKWLLLTFKWCV